MFNVTNIILVNITWSDLCLHSFLLSELIFLVACLGTNSLGHLGYWHVHGWSLLLSSFLCSAAPSRLYSDNRKESKQQSSTFIDPEPNHRSYHLSWERCTWKMYHMLQADKRAKEPPLVQRSHLTLPRILTFFPVKMPLAPSRFSTFFPLGRPVGLYSALCTEACYITWTQTKWASRLILCSRI